MHPVYDFMALQFAGSLVSSGYLPYAPLSSQPCHFRADPLPSRIPHTSRAAAPIISNPLQCNVIVCPGPPIVPCPVCVCLVCQSPSNRLSTSSKLSSFLGLLWTLVCYGHEPFASRRIHLRESRMERPPQRSTPSFWFLSPSLGPAQIVSRLLWAVTSVHANYSYYGVKRYQGKL